MQLYLLIALGGALGSVLRFAIDQTVMAQLGTAFPWATLIINVTGSFLIGVIYAVTESGVRWFAAPEIRIFLMTGVCGGYTTFSAFSLRTLLLARHGDWLYAGANIAGSVSMCLVAVWLGFLLGQAVSAPGTP